MKKIHNKMLSLSHNDEKTMNPNQEDVDWSKIVLLNKNQNPRMWRKEKKNATKTNLRVLAMDVDVKGVELKLCHVRRWWRGRFCFLFIFSKSFSPFFWIWFVFRVPLERKRLVRETGSATANTLYVKAGRFATCLKPGSDGPSSVLPLVVSEKWKLVFFLWPIYFVGQQIMHCWSLRLLPFLS